MSAPHHADVGHDGMPDLAAYLVQTGSRPM